MSQSSVIAATRDDELMRPDRTQEGKESLHLTPIRLEPLSMVSPKETQDVKNQDIGPR